MTEAEISRLAASIIANLITIGLELFFLIWTIVSIKKLKEENERIHIKLDEINGERNSDYKKMKALEDKITELENKLNKQ